MASVILKVVTVFFCLIISTQGHYGEGFYSGADPRPAQIPTRSSHTKVGVAQIYKLDLDLPPLEMWRQLVTDKKEYIKNFYNTAISEYVKIPQWILTILGSFGYIYHDAQFVAEVKAIAELSGLSFQQIFFANFADEFGSSANRCTSIVAQLQNNQLIHARNWDYGMVDILLNMTVHAQFYKGGKILYEADVVAGMVGVITAYKAQAFSITVNDRQYGSVLSIIYSILKNTSLNVPFLIRKTMETQDDFDSALEYIQTQDSDCPVYIIMCGTQSDEGVVITKSADSVYDVYQLDVAAGRWYVVQTNYDRGVQDPALDPRKTDAQNYLDSVGRANLTYSTMFQSVITQFPVFNNYTILTAMFQPSLNVFNTTLWEF